MRISFLTVAVWWLRVHAAVDAHRARAHSGPHLPFLERMRAGFRELANDVAHVRQYRTLALVPARVLVLHRRREHHHQDGGELRLFARASRPTPAHGAAGDPVRRLSRGVAFGWLGDRIGARRGVLIGIVVYFGHHGVCLFSRLRAGVLRDGGGVGLVQGGVQSLSRSLFGRLVPEGKKAEFFGFYNMMGKFADSARPAAHGASRRRHAQRARVDRLAGGAVRVRRLPALARARRSEIAHAASYATSRSKPDVFVEPRRGRTAMRVSAAISALPARSGRAVAMRVA